MDNETGNIIRTVYQLLVTLIWEDLLKKSNAERKNGASLRETILRFRANIFKSASELQNILDDDGRSPRPIWPADKRSNILNGLELIKLASSRIKPIDLWLFLIPLACVPLGTVACLVYYLGFRHVAAGPEFEKHHSSVQHDRSNGDQEEEAATFADEDERWT